MRKLLAKFDHVWEVDAVKSMLGQKNIAFYEIKGAREYSSLITGIGQGDVELYVDEEELAEAQAVLAQYKSATSLHLVSDEPSEVAVQEQKPHSSRKIYFLIAFIVLIALGIFEFIRQF